MQEPERSREPATPEDAWISQKENEEPTMQIATTADELCAMAHSQEKLNVRARWIAAAVVALLVGGFLYNVFSVGQPWIRVGQAWTLGVICYLYGTMLEREPRRIRTGEPCANFLEREFENKRRGFLAIRRGLFLLIPGIAVTCWGGGPVARAKALGLDPFSWQFQFATGPWPFLIIGVILAFVWFAFGKAAEKARHDQQDIRRSIES
jgi:hypothetical protein